MLFISRLSFWLLVLGVALSPLKTVRILSEVTIGDGLLLGSFLCVLVAIFGKHQVRAPVSFIFALILFLLTAIAQMIAADVPAGNLKSAAKFIVAICGLPLLIIIQPQLTVNKISYIAMAWVLGNSFNAVIAVAHNFGWLPDFLLAYISNSFWGRATGFSGHPNILSLFCAMALPLAFNFALNERATVQRGLFAVCVLLLVEGINLSGSRAGLLAALGTIFIVASLSPFTWRDARHFVAWNAVLLMGLGVACFLIFVTPEYAPAGLLRFLGGEQVVASDMERQAQWNSATADFFQSPLFGSGFSKLTEGHNLALQILASAGIFGALGVLLILASILLSFLAIRKQSELSPSVLLLSNALFASVIAWLITALFQPIIAERTQYVPIGLLLAMRLAMVFFASPAKSTTRSFRPSEVATSKSVATELVRFR